MTGGARRISWPARLGILALGLCCAAPVSAKADLFDALFGGRKRLAAAPAPARLSANSRDAQSRPAERRPVKPKRRTKPPAATAAPIEAPEYYQFSADGLARVDFRPLQSLSQATDDRRRVSCRIDTIEDAGKPAGGSASGKLPSAVRVTYRCTP